MNEGKALPIFSPSRSSNTDVIITWARHEPITCLNFRMRKLLRAMRDEYKARAPYIAYLVRCRQGLLSTLAHIERLLNRVKR